jgi:hypothetical protein
MQRSRPTEDDLPGSRSRQCLITILKTPPEGIIFTESRVTDVDMGLCIQGSSNVTFEGLQLKGSRGFSNHFAMWVRDDAKVTITGNSAISGNYGGLQIEGNASVTITGGTRIYDNLRIGDGGALHVSGNARVLVSKAYIFGNKALGQSSRGGAIFAGGQSAVTVLDYSTIQNNTAALGGGVAAVDEAKVMITHHSRVEANTAAGGVGGGVFADGNASVTVSSYANISMNVAVNDSSLVSKTIIQEGQGAAPPSPPPMPSSPALPRPGPMPEDFNFNFGLLRSMAPQGTPSDWPAGVSTPRGNHQNARVAPLWSALLPDDSNGQPVFKTIAGGGGVAATGYSHIVITENSTIHKNNASGLTGGGISAAMAALISIKSGSRVQHNVADQNHGGGIFLSGKAGIDNVDTEWLNNSAIGGVGGAVAAFGNATFNITNSTLKDNKAFVDLAKSALQGEGGALYAWDNATVSINGGNKFINNIALRGSDAHLGPFVTFSQDYPSSNATSIFWLRTECQVGEIRRFEWCESCPMGMFRFDAVGEVCLQCHLKANCTGGDVMYPLPGYWHSYKYSTQIHECPNPAACHYNTTTQKSCAGGYEGHVCGSCEKGWARLGSFNCVKCLEPVALVWFVFALGGVLLIALISYTVCATWQDNQSPGNALRPSDVLKVFITFMQYIIMILSSLKLSLGKAMSSIMSVFGVVLSAATHEMVALDCILPEKVWGLPRVIFGQLLYLLTPAFVFAAVTIVIFLLRHLRKGAEGRGFSNATSRQLLPVTALVVLFFFHPWLVHTGISMFACFQVDVANASYDPYPQHALAAAPHGYWVLDMHQACYSGWHKSWAFFLGIPCAVVFGGFVPLAIIVGLTRKKSKLKEPHFQQHFGFLYRNFRASKYYWGAVVTIENVLLVTVSVFSSTMGVYYATLVLNAAFGFLIIVQLLFKPFAVRKLQHLQLMSFGCLFATTYAGLSLLSVDRMAPREYRVFIALLVSVVNLGYIVWCWVCIAALAKDNVRSCVGGVYKWLGKPFVANRSEDKLPMGSLDSLEVGAGREDTVPTAASAVVVAGSSQSAAGV